MVGFYWIYACVSALFPARHYRRYYPGTRLAGKKFRATVIDEGIEVASDLTLTTSMWADITVTAADDQAFMLYSQDTATIFMFGKKYLSAEQQNELSRLIDEKFVATRNFGGQ
jgi:hypothetical protein